jgi:hypothetical protein
MGHWGTELNSKLLTSLVKPSLCWVVLRLELYLIWFMVTTLDLGARARRPARSVIPTNSYYIKQYGSAVYGFALIAEDIRMS